MLLSSQRVSLAILLVLASVLPSFGAQGQALFNGKDFSGWRYWSPQGTDIAKVCQIKSDGVIAVTGKPNGYIVTTTAYENYSLHIEWRVLGAKTNGGVLLHQSGPDKLWPLSMQFQMKVGAVGEFIPMSGFQQAEQLASGAKSLPRNAADAEKPVGEWNEADLLCQGDRIECRVNGVLVNAVTRCQPQKGWIGIQLEGLPFELRNLTLAPLAAPALKK